MYRIVFAITGASGMTLAKTALSIFAEMPDIEIHLIISDAARLVLDNEITDGASGLSEFAVAIYRENETGAPPASGSCLFDGMIICPCSMRTLSCIANGCGTNLIHRAADVALKERRRLILSPRESPLSLVHLRNMVSVTEAGAVVMPFMPAFYSCGESLQVAMKQFTGRLLDIFGIQNELCERWKSSVTSKNPETDTGACKKSY